MATKGVFTKKTVNLGGFSKEVYDLLKINPTTKFVIQRTGRNKNQVGNTLKKLISGGWIERVGKGVYKVKEVKRVHNLPSENSGVVNPVHNLSRELLKEADYLRLHNLDIQLRVHYKTHKQLYNLLLKRKTFKNIRSSGANKGYYFNLSNSNITYMITSKNIFAKFPKNWELLGNNVPELMEKTYDIIKDELNILQSRYNIICFKDGRVNFNIRNMHISLVKNGIAKEFYKKNLNNLVVYDDNDKKPRYIMDLSQGNFELEAVHSKKGFDDADEAQYFMHHLKDGKVRDNLDNSKTFFDESNFESKTTLSELKNTIAQITKTIDQLSKENKETASGLNSLSEVMKTQAQLLNEMLKSQQPSDNNHNGSQSTKSLNKPDYIG